MLAPSVTTVCVSFPFLCFAKISVMFPRFVLFVCFTFAMLHFLLKMLERLSHCEMLVLTTASFDD